MPVTVINPNLDGSYTLYDKGGLNVTLTFKHDYPPPAGFQVVTKDVDSGLPSGYTWVVNFGVRNPGGQYLPSVTYNLEGSSNKSWVIYYGNDPNPSKNIHAMNGLHRNAPGDPPIGHG
jgi:hypothetical protein